MIWTAHFAEKLPLAGGCVVAIGNFDGVHAGHKAVLAAAHSELPLVVLTFEPHPRVVLFPEKPLHRLTELPEKVRLLAQAGAEGVAVLDFNREVAQWSAQTFMDEVLVGWLGAKVVVVGEDFRFGHKASGDVATLQTDGRFVVRVVGLVRDVDGVVFSSRRLRGEG